MRILMVSGFKGGCGKTTLAHHLAVRAQERGLRVLAIDTDAQGDLYRRLLGDDANLADCPPASWAAGCKVVHSPESWSLPKRALFDLIVIDTPARAEPPEGPTPDMLVVPVDGVDAARNANETIAWARDRRVPATRILLNGVEEGGRRFARRFDAIRASAPGGVTVAPLPIPRGGSIKRTALSCLPAWRDMWLGKDAELMRATCDEMLTSLLAMEERIPTSPPRAQPTVVRAPKSATTLPPTVRSMDRVAKAGRHG